MVPYMSLIPSPHFSSLDRHLTKELHKPFSIIRGIQFAPSREKLKASRKWLKGQGKGNKPNAAEALEPLNVEKLWMKVHWVKMIQISSNKLFGGLYGHQRMWQTPQVSTGRLHPQILSRWNYVEFSAERGTKTRSGETVKSTNANAGSFKPKMWATPENPLKCPVTIFKAFVQYRPPDVYGWFTSLAINRKDSGIRSSP